MKKIISLMLALLMIASVCVLPVSAANVAFDVSDIRVTDAAKGIVTVTSNIENEAARENRYVTVIVLPNTLPLAEYMGNTLALNTAVVDLEGNFFTSFKFEEETGLYDFYVLYEGQAYGPVMYNFISLTDSANVIRNIANGTIPKTSLVAQIQAVNNGIGLDFDKFPVGFARDLFIYRLDKSRAEIVGETDAEILASFDALVDKIEDEVNFVEAFNAVTYSGDYLALLKNNVIHTGIDFTKFDKLESSLKSEVTDSFLGKTYKNGDEIKEAFDKAVEKASKKDASQGGGNGGGAGGGGGGGGATVPPANNREWGTEMEDNSANTPEQPKEEEPVKVTFTDIADVEWAKDAIEALAGKGIIAGKGEGIFDPNGLVTREQFAKMLVLAAEKYDESAVNEFTDIPEGDWSAAYVASAKAAGFVNGIGEGKFGYGESITREDMAVMIYNVMKSMGVDFSEVKDSFVDYDQISDYAKEAVGALAAKGIINGVGDNMFAPKDTATRAQAALLVYAIVKGVA